MTHRHASPRALKQTDGNARLVRRRALIGLSSICLLPITACRKEAKWKRHSYEDGGFTVEFPVVPSRRDMAAESDYGELKVRMVTAELGKQHYAVIYWDYPKEAPNEPKLVFDHALLDTAASLGGRVERHFEADRGKTPGRGYVLPFGSARVAVGRFYFEQGRLYHVQVALPAAEERHENVERFFESFRLRPFNGQGGPS